MTDEILVHQISCSCFFDRNPSAAGKGQKEVCALGIIGLFWLLRRVFVCGAILNTKTPQIRVFNTGSRTDDTIWSQQSTFVWYVAVLPCPGLSQSGHDSLASSLSSGELWGGFRPRKILPWFAQFCVFRHVNSSVLLV